MDDLEIKVSFLEARLTLLEHSFARLTAEKEAVAANLPSGEIVKIDCDHPSIWISQMYQVEYDDSKNKYCWVGSSGPIQIVLPRVTGGAVRCSVKLLPHPRVDFSPLKILVNDTQVEYTTTVIRDTTELTFVASGGSTKMNLIFSGVSSVRPSDFGENDDDRLVAARFYGAELTVL